VPAVHASGRLSPAAPQDLTAVASLASSAAPGYVPAMARYGIDPATLVHLLDSGQAVAEGHQLVAPSSLLSDALQLLLDDVRGGRRTEQSALKAHEAMTSLKVRLLGDRVSRRTAWRIAQQQGWTTLRDAEYLAVVQLQADALVTVDPALAARAAGIVATAGYEALFSDSGAERKAGPAASGR
jgi:predicted nucleic acid-binding protein